jgi:hypothetical protein
MAGGMSLLDGAAKLAKFQSHMEQDVRKEINAQIATAWRRVAVAEASADLGGDAKFSGWKPMLNTLNARTLPSGALILSPTKSAAGPWTVAESGRNQGNASGISGPGVSSDGTTRRTKSGKVRAVRARRARQWNGYTKGKGTASRVVAEVNRIAPEIADRELAKGLRSFFA